MIQSSGPNALFFLFANIGDHFSFTEPSGANHHVVIIGKMNERQPGLVVRDEALDLEVFLFVDPTDDTIYEMCAMDRRSGEFKIFDAPHLHDARVANRFSTCQVALLTPGDSGEMVEKTSRFDLPRFHSTMHLGAPEAAATIPNNGNVFTAAWKVVRSFFSGSPKPEEPASTN